MSAGALLAASGYLHAVAPLLFIFSFFIFFSALSARVSYRFMGGWAFFFVAGSLLPCAQVIQDYATGSIRQLLFISICWYLTALCVSITFVVTKVQARLRFRSRLILPLICTLFFWGASGYALLPFGVMYGFPVLNPLVPLIYTHSFFTYLVILNQWGALYAALFLIEQMAHGLTHKRWGLIVITGAVLVFIFVPLPQKAPDRITQELAKRIYQVPTTAFHPDDTAWDRAEKIAGALSEVPDATIACLPESAFPYPLNEYPVFGALWDQSMPHGSTLLIGAHHKKNDRLYNSLYQLKEGRIIQIYDKKYCLPLVEHNAVNWVFLQGICSFFSTTKDIFCNAHAASLPVKLTENFSCMPLICSELLCRTRDPQPAACPIVCIANDRWFKWPAARQTMALIARLRALTWRRTIIYCSYSYTFIAAPDGAIIHR
jgi:hypothetical protein